MEDKVILSLEKYEEFKNLENKYKAIIDFLIEIDKKYGLAEINIFLLKKGYKA